jgi:fucose permease
MYQLQSPLVGMTPLNSMEKLPTFSFASSSPVPDQSTRGKLTKIQNRTFRIEIIANFFYFGAHTNPGTANACKCYNDKAADQNSNFHKYRSAFAITRRSYLLYSIRF